MRILNHTQARAADRRAIEEYGISAESLMENAGLSVVGALERTLGSLDHLRVGVLCGTGNNGGDGLVVSRLLSAFQCCVEVWVVGDKTRFSRETEAQYSKVLSAGISVSTISVVEEVEDREEELDRSDVLIDALLGTGINKALTGLLKAIVLQVNRSRCFVVSIDVPTGITDSGASKVSIQADLTVSLGAMKSALLVPSKRDSVGDLCIGDIGLPPEVIEGLEGPLLSLLTPQEISAVIPKRKCSSHKGNYGHVMIIGGAIGKTGAAILAGCGALKSGTGLVTIAAPVKSVPAISAYMPDYMTFSLIQTSSGEIKDECIDGILRSGVDVIAAGPGLGTESFMRSLLYRLFESSTCRLVLDADALNICALDMERLRNRNRTSEVVITPHPGEMARLCDESVETVQNNRVEMAKAFSGDYGVYVILKGANTVISSPEGKVFVNPTGNPGMATGGAGDLLAGAVAAWMGQLDVLDACKTATYIHGLAGDIAMEESGEISLTATDIKNCLSKATIEVCMQ